MVGSAACEKGIKRSKVRLMLLSTALSDGSMTMFERLCERCSVDVIKTDDPIGKAIGRAEVMVIGITDQGFATTIKKAVERVKGSG